MSDDKIREEFEAWYLAEYYEGDKQCGLEWLSTEPCGGYRHAEPAREFKAWKASREALVIELPELHELQDRRSWSLSYAKAHNEAINSCAKAIEAAGVKVKQ